MCRSSIGVHRQCLHMEHHRRGREAGENATVPVWNGRRAVACQGFERRIRAAVTRQCSQCAVDGCLTAAAVQGVGKNLADNLIMLGGADAAVSESRELRRCRHDDRCRRNRRGNIMCRRLSAVEQLSWGVARRRIICD